MLSRQWYLCRTMACFHLISIAMISSGDNIVHTSFMSMTHYDTTMGNEIARMPLYGITMGNDIAGDIKCDITMGNDVVMCTYGITMHNDVAMKLVCNVLLRQSMILVSPRNSLNYTHKSLRSISNQ